MPSRGLAGCPRGVTVREQALDLRLRQSVRAHRGVRALARDLGRHIAGIRDHAASETLCGAIRAVIAHHDETELSRIDLGKLRNIGRDLAALRPLGHVGGNFLYGFLQIGNGASPARTKRGLIEKRRECMGCRASLPSTEITQSRARPARP